MLRGIWAGSGDIDVSPVLCCFFGPFRFDRSSLLLLVASAWPRCTQVRFQYRITTAWLTRRFLDSLWNPSTDSNFGNRPRLGLLLRFYSIPLLGSKRGGSNLLAIRSLVRFKTMERSEMTVIFIYFLMAERCWVNICSLLLLFPLYPKRIRNRELGSKRVSITLACSFVGML